MLHLRVCLAEIKCHKSTEKNRIVRTKDSVDIGISNRNGSEGSVSRYREHFTEILRDFETAISLANTYKEGRVKNIRNIPTI